MTCCWAVMEEGGEGLYDGGGWGPGCWRCGVRRALIVVSVECWWMRSGCSMLRSCWVVRLAGGGWCAGGRLICTGCV